MTRWMDAFQITIGGAVMDLRRNVAFAASLWRMGLFAPVDSESDAARLARVEGVSAGVELRRNDSFAEWAVRVMETLFLSSGGVADGGDAAGVVTTWRLRLELEELRVPALARGRTRGTGSHDCWEKAFGSLHGGRLPRLHAPRRDS